MSQRGDAPQKVLATARESLQHRALERKASAMRIAYTNRLLAELAAEEQRRLEPHLVLVFLQQDAVLCTDGSAVSHVYFPTTALVSILCGTSTGDSLDVAVTGAEGIVGLSFAASGHWSPGRTVVQCSGHAWRLPAPVLHQEFGRGGPLQSQLLRYHQRLMAQIAQAAVCSRLHRVDQQLCRWILDSLDRRGGDRIDATQQQVARMLGVRREAVSMAAGKLEDHGVLHWGRGHLRVRDRAALESHCCECYHRLRGQPHACGPVMPRAA